MSDKLIFWAQALDSKSPNHIVANGVVLSPDNDAVWRAASAAVACVHWSGPAVYDANDVELIANRRQLLVKVPSQQKDNKGRTAPVVCYAEFNANDIDVVGQKISTGLVGFATSIGLSIEPTNMAHVERAFGALRSSIKKRRLFLLLVIVVFIGLAGCGVWLMLKRAS